MKTNCRNCKWSKWMLTESGRRRYGNYAECIYPVAIKLPASRMIMADELRRKVAVREYMDVNISCDTWEKMEPKK